MGGSKTVSGAGGMAERVFGGSSAGKFIANRSDAGQGRGDEIAVKMNCSLIVGTFAAARAGPGRVQSARREKRSSSPSSTTSRAVLAMRRAETVCLSRVLCGDEHGGTLSDPGPDD